jgi:hypothetical protein
MTLSTMALMELLDGELRTSLSFANLPEVKAALDTVFLDGDLNGNGVTDGADLAIWKAGFGANFNATPAGGDADGDGDVDGADFLRWQRGAGDTTAQLPTEQTVPEPHLLGMAVWAGVALAGVQRTSTGRR